MSRSNTLCFMVATLVLGCGSSDDESPKGPTCKDQTFALKGTVGADPIDLTAPLGSYVVNVGAGTDATVAFGNQGALKLTHAAALDLDAPSPATGTLTLPADAPTLASEVLCAGSGSTLTQEYDQGLRSGWVFSLTGLATGTSCATPVQGSLEGCFTAVFEAGP